MERLKNIIVASDASGAAKAAADQMLVMIVDVIDMSTALESALDAGAFAVFGCSPDVTRVPVKVDPELIGREAGRLASKAGCGIVLIAEPRVGTDEDRAAKCTRVIKGIKSENGYLERIIPNIGAEVPKLAELKNKVVIAVTETGGAAFDAAYTVSKDVITGTVARTLCQKGINPALTAVRRAVGSIRDEHTGIAVVAASRNSMEDILAAQFIANLLLKDGY